MNGARGQFAGFLLLMLVAHGSAAQDGAAPANPDVAGRLAVLSRQADAAEALRSVKRLQWAYGHYSEFGLWHDFSDLFADTGVGHYAQGDLDREAIRALFLDEVGQGHVGLADGRLYPHISFAPVVTLDADGAHANARFRILGMLGGYGGNATWFHGLYENAYVKEGGVWKLDELTNAAQITGNFTAGLAASAAPALAFHFTPEQAGDIVTPARAAGATLASLQQRLRRLEDETSVANLQHRFGYYFDNHEWDKLVELFAEQGTLELGQRGVYIGKTSIRNALNELGMLAAGQVDDHILFQTYVSVAPDGASAAARVDQLGMQGRRGGSAEWTQGIYENTFIKEGGIWRIQSLHYYPRLITDYAKGWAVDAQAMPGPSAAFPPDAPPTEVFANYPAFYLPAFHFAHPVTGRAPQYPPGSPAAARPPGFPAVPQQDAADLDVSESGLAMTELLARRIIGSDAVENLVNAYAYYLDACMTAAAAALFTATGEIEIPEAGRYRGEEIAAALRTHYCDNQRQGVQHLRHLMQPLSSVTADAEAASITTRMWQVSAGIGDDDYYRSALVHATAVPEGAGWKLSTLALEYRWSARVSDGWTVAAPATAVPE